MENFLISENTTSYLAKPSFSGHQTFPFRYTWLKKGVDAVKDPAIFSSKNASVTLGVGKNMVSSIRHWCTVADLIMPNKNQRGSFDPTPLGLAIFNNETGFDPYLEDPATLWLIHWKIATNINQATAWYWAFNIFRENQFTPDIFKKQLPEWAEQQQETSTRPASENTLQRDIQCFIRTYCQSRHATAVIEESFDCPLVELNLITELPKNNGYEFLRGEKETLPIEVFASTLIAFWDASSAKTNELSFSKLMYEPLSPGRIFRLDEDTMTARLETLSKLTNNALQYRETAGLKQVHRHKDLNPMDLLERYYEQHSFVRSV